jgi:hypothetical protein
MPWLILFSAIVAAVIEAAQRRMVDNLVHSVAFLGT